jgi:hypothetical protein
VFERRSSLVGPIVISILLFPFGLIALLGRAWRQSRSSAPARRLDDEALQ